MDIKQLKYFVAIANEHQITKAAQKLYLTQPSLSRQLKMLEDEVGTCLIQRTNQKMELTEDGQEFLVKAQDILARMENLKILPSQNPAEFTGTLKVGTLISCTSILAEYLEQFHQTFPKVTFKVWEDPPHVLVERLKKQEIDVAFLRAPTFDPVGLCTRVLEKNSFYLVIARNCDPFPEKDEILARELVQVPLILLHTGKQIGYNELIETDLVEHGLHSQIVCQCSNSSISMKLVEMGLGGTILPFPEHESKSNDQLCFKKIVDFASHSDPTVVWNDNTYLPFLARNFLKIMGIDVSKELQ